jgi:hypothetical protein
MPIRRRTVKPIHPRHPAKSDGIINILGRNSRIYPGDEADTPLSMSHIQTI